jgi:hypothetical protein
VTAPTTAGLAGEFRASTQGLSVPMLHKATATFWRAHQDRPDRVFAAMLELWPRTAGETDRPVRLGAVMTSGPAAAAGVSGAAEFLTGEVAGEADWRVQEALAKAFDWMCDEIGWPAALPVIDDWIGHAHPNVRRAASEGPRVWTRRPYFDQHPAKALEILGRLRSDPSEYVRKSVANAVSDLSKSEPELVLAALHRWAAEGPACAYVVRHAARHLRKTHPDRLPS